MLTDVQKIQLALDSVKPMVQMHGGNIEFDRIEADVVYVRMQGACVGCPASWYTLKMGIEQAVKEQLPNIKEVVSVDDE